MSEPGFRLTVRGPDDVTREQRFPLGAVVTVGRDPRSDVKLPSPGVSRRHVELELGGEIVIRDCSSNGTHFAGELLRSASRVVNEERVELCVGHYRLLLERSDAEARVGPRSDAPQLDAPWEEPEEPRSRESEVASPGNALPASVRRRVHAALLESLNLHEREIPREPDAALRGEVLRELERLVAETSFGVPARVRSRLALELVDEALGLGPLEPLLADPSVSEVMVVDAATIYVERRGRVVRTEARFTDDVAVRTTIERIVTPLGRRIDESSPLVDARLADGSRVNAVIPPLALRGPTITIRKFPDKRLGMADLVEAGALSPEMARFLERAVALRKNVVISGGTGSGKTTLLGALSASIGASERVVTIEDAAELSLAQPHVVALESKPPNLEGCGEFTIRDLLKNALRMRPDRIIVGECRGGEALDMLQAMNTGHEGSMTTTHASSPLRAILRIETLCLMAGVELPLSAIRRQIASSINLVVQQSRLGDGSRKVTSVAEVTGIDEHGAVELRELYVHGPRGHQPTGFFPSFLEELAGESRAH